MSTRSRLHAWLQSSTFLSIGLIALAAASSPTRAQTAWTGTTSSDWFDAGNWTPAAVPNAGTVVLDTTTPSPTIIAGAPATAGTVIVGDTASGQLTLGEGGTLTAGSVIIANQAGSTGTLTIGGTAPVGQLNTTTVTFGAGTGTININHTAFVPYTLAAQISGNGAVTVQAGFTFSPPVTIFTADNTYTGGTTINGAVLHLGNGGTTGSIVGDVVLASTLPFATGTLSINRSDTLTLNGNISGIGLITQVGTGTTVLTGNNTYQGNTNIFNGTLVAGSDTALGLSIVNIAGGTLGYADGVTINNQVAGSFAPGAVNLGVASGTATQAGEITTFAGPVVKVGAGTLVLTADSTNVAGVTIDAGRLQFGAGGTTGSITANITNNSVLAFNRSDTFTFANDITGNGAVEQNGSGTTIFTGTNTYSGGTTINAGTLQLGNGGITGSIVGNVTNNGTLAFNRSDDVTFAGVISGNGTVDVRSGNVSVTADNTYTGGTTIRGGALLALGDGGASGAIAGNVVLDGGGLAFNRSDAVTFVGAISGTGIVIQVGSGTTILAGNNTYTGNTQIFFGTLVAGTSSALGTGLVLINGGATLGYADGITITNQIGSLAGLGASITLEVATGTATQAGTITPPFFGGLVKSGAGTLVVTSDNIFPLSSTTISAGRLQLGDGNTTGSIVSDIVNNSILAFNRSDTVTFANTISGTGVVEQNGTGTTVLTGANSYLGGTIINAGTLSVSSDANLGDPNGGITFNGGTLQNTAAFTTMRAITLNAAGGTFQTDTDLEIGGDITGDGGLTKTGTATLTLTGNNNFDGPTIINAGTLLAATSTALSPLSAITVNAGAALEVLDGGIFAGAGSLAGDGLVVIGTGSILVVGLNDQSTTFSGSINGNGSFEKEGAGTLTLTGTSSIGGILSVCCGTLDINGGSFTAGLTDIGFGTLAITNGGRLQTGDLLNSANLLITGPGSVATASGDTVIGAFDIATATISNGGRLESLGDAFIGMASTITVTGTGSAWTIAGGLGIGDPFGGPGALTVADGAVVTVTGPTIIDASGILFLGDGALAGSIVTPLIINDGQIVANFTDTLVLAVPIDGGGALFQTGAGTLILTGDNTYTGGTSITAGRLQLGNGGTTGSIVGDVANDAILAFNRSDAVTFAGVISGTGSVEHNGTGTTTLTGANTYSGGTVLNAGTLSVSADTNLGSASGGLTFNSGTLQNTAAFVTARNVTLNAAGGTFQTDADLTVGGVISGTGGLTKTGTATLILTGNNTYAGTTTITAGTLQLGNGGTTGSIAGDVVNNAVLAFNRSDTLIVGGAISGTGVVQQNGTGTTALTGANTHSGGTTINAGTLQLGNGGTTGSITGNVTNNGALAFNRSNTLTVDGVISGTGTVQQNGTGTTVLTGTSTYTGGTTVNAGRLIVNGTIASTVAVNGGVLGGSGTVGGITANSGGTVSPGNSVGTINVAGDVAFAAGSTYLVEIDAANNADRIVATGIATLSGGTVQVQKTGTYTAGTRHTILSANGGVNGTFGGLTTTGTSLPLIDLLLSYDPTNVYLDVTRNAVTFCGIAATGNQCATGTGTESLGAGNAIYDAIANLPDAASIRRAFDLLSGEIHASTAATMVGQSQYLRDAVIGRVRQSYGAAGPATALAPEGKVMAFAGTAPGVIPDATPADAAARLFAQAPAAPATGDTVIAAWTQGIGAWSKRSGDGNAGTLNGSLGGFLIGVDATFERTWRVGLAAGYTRASFDVDSRASSGHSDNVHVALYGGGQLGALGLRAGASLTWHAIDTTRRVAFPGVADRLKADYNARTTQIFGEAGYALSFDRVSVEPFAGLAYVNYRSDRINETGGAAALTGRRQAFDMGFSTLGLRAAATVTAPSDTTVATVRGTLGWRHAFGDVTPEQRLAFRTGSDPFTVVGVPIARDSLLVEAGLDVDVTNYARFGLTYSGQFATKARDHAVKGSLTLRF
ncbi:autotransporter-associated beta strand repeat-containing protein [Reyranella sp. CPCC 100927]|uniref:autotransporter-associated beta strand repeat-containing protein n=1 Tax=Reyranella sp. CPCC 100927 TaxID=2599616 RepID=UPI0011B6CE41|nr:autotransporter-associated beta strand repeat-containing protein [Reyranella sp. CPCC 100927]TWT11624.1 autotransporter domain-containing protein [Reyranella sp. CPCC 100927]